MVQWCNMTCGSKPLQCVHGCDGWQHRDRGASALAGRARGDAAKGGLEIAHQIFGDRREVWIEYHGERYRLRITRRGKLILQK